MHATLIRESARLIHSLARSPIQGMGLEVAGVEYNEHRGVIVDDYLQTTNKNIFAVGDVCTQYKVRQRWFSCSVWQWRRY